MSFKELSQIVAELHQKLLDVRHELPPQDVERASKEYWQNANGDFQQLNIARVELLSKKMRDIATRDDEQRYSDILQKMEIYTAQNPYNLWNAEREKRAAEVAEQLTQAQNKLKDYLKHPAP